MNKKSFYLFYSLIFLIALLVGEVVYLQLFKTISISDLKIKKAYMKMVALPDLALANEAMFIRHRSLTSTFELFPDSPSLLGYFPSTFTYKYSNILKKEEKFDK